MEFVRCNFKDNTGEILTHGIYLINSMVTTSNCVITESQIDLSSPRAAGFFFLLSKSFLNVTNNTLIENQYGK